MTSHVRTGISICLVDENPVTRNKLGDLLNGMGIHIPIFCTTLQEAIVEYENYTVVGPPSFILTEWTREFYDPAFIAFFKNSPLAEIPIILLYDDSKSATLSRIDEIRIFQFLKKPLSIADINEIISNYLNNETSNKDERNNQVL